MADTDTEKSLHVKSALADIVLPETLEDIDEYLKPEFPSKHDRKSNEQAKEMEDNINGRRIVMDGFGRWREIRPKNKIPRDKLVLIKPEQLPQMKQLFGVTTPLSTRTGSVFGTPEKSHSFPGTSHHREQYSSRGKSSQPLSTENTSMYETLGMNTRSNVFPGIGNFQWKSTTSGTFTEKPVKAVEDRKNFYGIVSDDFSAWSAANVLNDRMKKSWEEYLASVPKVSAKWSPTTQSQPVKPSPPQTKPLKKKAPPKPKLEKQGIVTNANPLQAPASPPSEPPHPPYVPGDDDGDDSFWDFYDKPFNKPK